jgi:tetratricopeptide (TPR) repeat protein
MKIKWVLAVACGVFLSILSSVHAEEDFETYFSLAEDSYKNKLYSRSIELYENMIQKGYKNGSVYYNLGNAFYAKKQLGDAAAAYEYARFYLGGDAELLHNIGLIREETKQVPLKDISFVSDRINHLFQWVPFFLFSQLLFLLYALYFFTKILGFYVMRVQNFIARFQTGFMIFFFSLLLILSIPAYDRYMVTRLIVLDKGILLRNGPAETFEKVRDMEWAARCRVVQLSDGWYQVKTEDHVTGWLPASSVVVIKPLS